MSTTVAQPMGYQPFTNQCFDPDMDSLVDFNAIQSPAPTSSSSHIPPSTVTSTMSSPTNTLLPLDHSEDHQTPAKPSHEYDLFKQQTGLPSGSVPGIGMSNMNQPVYGNHQQMFSNSGLGFDEYNISMSSNMDLDMGSNNGLPAFFFSPEGQSDDFVDPSAISHEEPQQTVRFFPGMHQQQAALAAKAQAQQQRQQQMIQQQQRERAAQQSGAHAQRKPAHYTDPRTEEIIGRVVNQIRQNSTLQSQPDMQASNVLPHIIKMKKDEEDMDEDERLLASEEGKKLSSKERRQLRNKVSARAFRSRRKEYISQLEGEVAAKSNEANDLRLQNRALMEENARSRAFIERLLRHQAFGPFLDELSRDPALTEPVKLASPVAAPRQENFNSAPQMMKENNSQMGMNTIPEQQVDMSMLNINNGYFPNTGFNFNQPQVFAVFEVPQGPADLFNSEILSGKGSSSEIEEPIEEIKHDYPVIERPVIEAEQPAEAEAEEVDANPDFALYVNSPAPSTAAPADRESFASEKASALVTAEESEEQLQQRLDRMCKKMNTVFERMQSMTFDFDLVASLTASARRFTTLTNPLLLVHRSSLRKPPPVYTSNTASHRGASESNKSPSSVLDSLKSILQSHLRSKKPKSPTLKSPTPVRKAEFFEEQSYAAPDLGFNKIFESPRFEYSNNAKQYRTHVIYPDEPWPKFLRDARGTEIEIKADRNRSYTVKLDEKYIASKMKSFIQILTTPTADTPGTTLLLHFDDKRYLFGSIGEGTQRAMNEMGTRMLKMQEFFITGRAEWKNTGGLIGMMLTLADAAKLSNSTRKERGVEEEKKKLTMFGPPNLNYSIATCRRFVFRKGLPIDAVDVKDELVEKDKNGDPLPVFMDGNTKVWAMAVSPSGSAPKAHPSAGTKSRKRSYDELNGIEPATTTPKENPEETAARYEQLTRSVVSQMFDSNWRLDALIEKPLSEVKLPATIFQRNTVTKAIEKYTGPVPDPANPNRTVLVREPWPGAKILALPPTEPAPQAISYIIRNHPQRGKFQVDKAIALGVPKGRKWSQLQSGEAVTNERGDVVTADMVLSPTRRGRGVAVVDLPSTEYVDALIKREEWKSQDIMDGIEAFIWILGPGVAADQRLKDFMAGREKLQHIISSVDVCPNRLTFDSASGATLRLNRIDPKRYGVPVYDTTTTPQESYASPNNLVEDLPAYAQPAQRGQAIQLEPKFEIQSRQIVPPLDPTEVLKSVSEDVLAEARQIRDSIKNSTSELEKWRRKLPCSDAEIITLGTGSALPSKYRNVSATLVRVPGYGSYLLDAGEGTLGQMQRVFKPAELKQILKELRVIWLSHMHADHILGTVGVIKAWYDVVHNSQPTSESALAALESFKENPSLAAQSKRLAVIADIQMVNWLAEYSNVEDFGYSHLWPLTCSAYSAAKKEQSRLILGAPPTFLPQELPTPLVIPPELYPELFGLQDLQAVFVNHCYGARAVSMTWPDATKVDPEDPGCYPFKVSYSGDCRPCIPFTRIGRHSTVLVHEATFDDELADDAVAKKHSTTAEALAIGARMRAKTTLLTHFSQRYQKIPVIERDTEGPSDEELDVDEVDDATVAAAEEVDTQEAQADEPIDQVDGPPAPTSAEEAVTEAATSSVLLPKIATLRTEESGELATKIRARSNMRVGVAADYMRVKVGEFAELEKYVPALQALLTEEKKMDDEEKAKRVEEDRVRKAVEEEETNRRKEVQAQRRQQGKQDKQQKQGKQRGKGKGKKEQQQQQQSDEQEQE